MDDGSSPARVGVRIVESGNASSFFGGPLHIYQGARNAKYPNHTGFRDSVIRGGCTDGSGNRDTGIPVSGVSLCFVCSGSMNNTI